MTSTKQFTIITNSLQQFNFLISQIKKLLDQDDCKVSNYIIIQANFLFQNSKISQNQTKYQFGQIQDFNRCNILSQQIKIQFKADNFGLGERLKIQKLEKDFKQLLNIYASLIKKYQRMRQKDLQQRRSTYKQIIRKSQINKNSKNNDRSMNQSQNISAFTNEQQKIQMIEVNQDILFQGQMIEQKAKQLLEIKDQMQNVFQIQKQIGVLIESQGDQLDGVENNIVTVKQNVEDSKQLMKDAQQHYKSANKKKLWIMLIVAIIVIIIVVPICIKFAN